MRSPAYLVQVRTHGEAWKTVERYPTLASAQRLANLLATKTRRWRERASGYLVDHPEHPFIRVTLGAATVYDPRAVSNVRPNDTACHANSAPETRSERGQTS